MSEAEPSAPATRKRRNRPLPTVDEAPEVAEPGAAGRSVGGNLLWGLGKLVTVLLLLAGCMSGVIYAANRFFTTSPRFGVAKLEVEGSRRFGEDQLLHLAGVKRGDNLFALDLDALERKLTENPWIDSAKLSRRLPDALKISVTEHVAVALAGVDSVLYLVTRDGTPIVPLDLGDPADFPVITGITAQDLQQDRKRAQERIAQGIAIHERYERLPLSQVYPTQEVQMGAGGDVRLIVGDAGITLMLGTGSVKQKLLMAGRVMGKLKERGQTPGIVFLDNQAHPERVVVRLR